MKKNAICIAMEIEIKLNGEAYSFSHSLTVQELVEKLALPCEKIAIERNLEIVPRSLYAKTTLQNGDLLEIVHFIGGG